jgi:putative endonuclease
MNNNLTTIKKGVYYEDLALRYLMQQGLKLKERNYLCKLGELDLLMQDSEFLVIVEVRYRKNNFYGGAIESITKTKQKKIIAATQHYLQQSKIKSSIRFDVVGITGESAPVWIKSAF